MRMVMDERYVGAGVGLKKRLLGGRVGDFECGLFNSDLK